MNQATAVPVRHLLSFDVEEYFQVEAAARTVNRADWPTWPPRAAAAVDLLLRLLGESGASATFFVLGWVARRDPDCVRRIAAAGHEIASHGMDHQMLGRLTPAEFRRQLDESRQLLEELSGRPVRGYRAPTFSVTHETAWALDVLAEAGFRYDSSVHPVRHDRYGVPEAPVFAHRAVGPAGGAILEIPPTTLRLGGSNLPVGGGGYLRLLPVRLTGWALRRAARAGQPGMIYMHPWEFDPDQPETGIKGLSRWRHRVNLDRTEPKLRWLLREFRFTSVSAILDDLATTTETFHYGRPAGK